MWLEKHLEKPLINALIKIEVFIYEPPKSSQSSRIENNVPKALEALVESFDDNKTMSF